MKDIVVKEIIDRELDRQRYELNMIPSENYCSEDVLKACGSVLNNKYSEGYSGKRYYQGNRFIDEVELLAIERAKKLFSADHANVQANSGSPANMAAYFAVLNPGDKIMGMDLTHGGHLTHGSKVNFSGKMYNFVSYGVQENGLLDMDKIRKLAYEEKPKMIISGYTAYPRKIDFKEFFSICQEIGAYALADVSHIAGLCVGGEHENPAPYFDITTSTTHKTLRGPRSAVILCNKEDRFASVEGLDEKKAKKTKDLGGKIDRAVFPGLQGGPHEHTIAAKAVCFQEAMGDDFKNYASQIVKNAKALAESLQTYGMTLVSGGTDNHLILIDLVKTKGEASLGKPIAVALEKAGIVMNANTIPFEPGSPFKPSGLRLGTPVLTTRGMKEQEMDLVGHWISEVVKDHTNEDKLKFINNKVKELCTHFTFY
ncbi:serine hydroxymethyltransferase [archaeon]|jgi:glycine hydroxymethyltransferase|nr:serine hydroxymethyltransferase [archaeon]MBT4397256.1 serine hydroxymethyltransferase [archaeon]MBT4440636.1 serine hydroxymethyltransferase [archaeon]